MAQPDATVAAAEPVAEESVAPVTVAAEAIPVGNGNGAAADNVAEPTSKATDGAPVGAEADNVAEPTKIVQEVANGNKEITVLDKKIIKQVEYYFGDVNLPKDKFLQEQIKLDEGWIPLDIMLKFKRLAALSSDAGVIVDAVAKSNAKIIEISEDRKKIRRSSEKPLPILNEERRQELVTRTVYAKGYPATGMILDDFFVIFSKYGAIDNLYMRTLKDKATGEIIFKGSVYVTYSNLESAKAFMALESFKHGDVELKRMWQADHLDLKRKERDARKDKVKQDAHDSKTEQAANKEPDAKEKPGTFAKGCVLHLQGFSGEITREDIKSELVPLGATIAFVTYNKGDGEAWVRLENSAKEVFSKMDDGKIEVCGNELEVRVLEGEEEDKFLTKSMDDLLSRRSTNHHRGGRGGGGRGGRGFRGGRGKGGFRGRGGNKRKGDRDAGGDGSSAKQQRT